jgi:hypothetical protein
MGWLKNLKECETPIRFVKMDKIPSHILRKMGYKSDSQGIIARYMNVPEDWEGHLEHTRNFILKAVTGKKINNLAVYGSGWLLDLPLDALSGLARHIWLYDVIHPVQVLHRLRKYTNISAVAADVTGGAITATYQAVHDYKKHDKRISPEQLCNLIFQPDVKPDYAISLNILSQIGEMISEYLKQQVPYIQEEITSIICLLQQSHLRLLQPGRSCLITDVKECCYSREDRLIETNLLIKCPLPVPKQAENWEWQFDPLGEYRPGMKTISRVVAFEL